MSIHSSEAAAPEALISLEEAATLLDYKQCGLRKIVERTRAKLSGKAITGPTIRYFQTCKSAPIKFRREWIDEFIDRHSIGPEEIDADGRDAPTTSGAKSLRSQGDHGF